MKKLSLLILFFTLFASSISFAGVNYYYFWFGAALEVENQTGFYEIVQYNIYNGTPQTTPVYARAEKSAGYAEIDVVVYYAGGTSGTGGVSAYLNNYISSDNREYVDAVNYSSLHVTIFISSYSSSIYAYARGGLDFPTGCCQ